MTDIHSQSEVEYLSTSEHLQSQTHAAHSQGVPADTAVFFLTLAGAASDRNVNHGSTIHKSPAWCKTPAGYASRHGATRTLMQEQPASSGPPVLVHANTSPTPGQSAPASVAVDRVKYAQTQHVSYSGFELDGRAGTTAQLQIAGVLAASPSMPGIKGLFVTYLVTPSVVHKGPFICAITGSMPTAPPPSSRTRSHGAVSLR